MVKYMCLAVSCNSQNYIGNNKYFENTNNYV